MIACFLDGNSCALFVSRRLLKEKLQFVRGIALGIDSAVLELQERTWPASGSPPHRGTHTHHDGSSVDPFTR